MPEITARPLDTLSKPPTVESALSLLKERLQILDETTKGLAAKLAPILPPLEDKKALTGGAILRNSRDSQVVEDIRSLEQLTNEIHNRVDELVGAVQL